MGMFLALPIWVYGTADLSLAAIEGFWPIGREHGDALYLIHQPHQNK